VGRSWIYGSTTKPQILEDMQERPLLPLRVWQFAMAVISLDFFLEIIDSRSKEYDEVHVLF